jgi:hypothetical protein
VVISSIFYLNRENLVALVRDLTGVKKNSLLCSIERSGETENLNLAHAWPGTLSGKNNLKVS